MMNETSLAIYGMLFVAYDKWYWGDHEDGVDDGIWSYEFWRWLRAKAKGR